MAAVIDLNADVGEERGDDGALLSIVTTASVAAGGHAGGGDVLERTVRIAAAGSVAVGAHPSYPDRPGFGRLSRADEHDSVSIATFVAEQVLTVAAACAVRGVALSHVKAHGALYNDSAADESIASAFLAGVHDAASDLGLPTISVMGLPGSALETVAKQARSPFQAEAYADRAYAPDGRLVPRTQPGAVLSDPEAVARQAVRLAVDGTVMAIDGSLIRVRAVTICVHGDTPGAVAAARLARDELERHGVSVSAVARSG